jgi:hypothetical protein
MGRKVNNIKMDLRVIGWDDMDWLALAQDRSQWKALVNTVMNSELLGFWTFAIIQYYKTIF